MEENIYEMVDSDEGLTGGNSFLLKTTCPKEKLEEIAKNAERIFSCDDEEVEPKYQKYIEKYSSYSCYEILMSITMDEGFTWQEIEFPKIEW